MDNLLWSEDCDYVYGAKELFKDENDFINTVKEAYKGFDNKECEVSNIKLQACISTEKGLPGDCLVPLSLTDVEICNYYTADVEEID